MHATVTATTTAFAMASLLAAARALRELLRTLATTTTDTTEIQRVLKSVGTAMIPAAAGWELPHGDLPLLLQ